jgi:hypothetical protein
MRVGYKDINNGNLVLYISPSLAETPKQEVRRPNGGAGFKLVASRCESDGTEKDTKLTS